MTIVQILHDMTRRTQDGDWAADDVQARDLSRGAAVIPTWMWINDPRGMIPSGTLFARKRVNVAQDPAWYPILAPEGYEAPPERPTDPEELKEWTDIYGKYEEGVSCAFLGSSSVGQQFLENDGSAALSPVEPREFQIGILYEPVVDLDLRKEAAMITRRGFRAYADRLPRWQYHNRDNKRALHDYFELIFKADVL